MPIYEYSCKDCSEKTSILFKSLDENKNPICGSCNSANMERMISSVAVLHSSQDLHRQYDSMASYRDSIDEKDPFDGKGDYLKENL